MARRHPTKDVTDPLLRKNSWRATVRAHWIREGRRRGLPCSRCGGPIDYNASAYFPGTRRINPQSLAVGHIVDRYEAKQRGWTDDQINSISNTQVECRGCSDRSGGQALARLQREGLIPRSSRRSAPVEPISTPDQLDTSEEW